MTGYETTVVLRPGASDEQGAQLKAKVEGIIKAEGGDLLNYEDWGTRRLAFVRQRENKGHYHFFAFSGKSTTVAEIERNLRINEQVMLYLSIRKAAADDAEAMAALREPSAMMKAKDRPARDRFSGEGKFGGDDRKFEGRGGRDEGFRRE